MLAQSLSGAPGLGLFLAVFLWLMGTAFPSVVVSGQVMAAAWQEGGEWGKCFGLLGSPRACGAAPKGSPAALGVGTVCFSLLLNQALHKSLEELPLVWRGGQAALAWFFLFTSLFHHTAQHLCSRPSTSCDHFSVGTRVTLFTNCCNVRLLNNSVCNWNPGCSQKWWEMCSLQTAVPPGGRTAKLQQQQLSFC